VAAPHRPTRPKLCPAAPSHIRSTYHSSRVLADEDYRSINYQRYSYLARGIYVDQLKEWHRCFDREQLLILKSEDFFARPLEILELVLEFLDLPERAFELEGKRNEGGYSWPMEPETRRWLQQYYKPHY
jgi:hypothetical protein